MALFYRILFLVSFICETSFAQKATYKSNLIDSISKMPVSFATLSINGNRYYAADSVGVFILQKEQINLGDTLRFSHLGYTSKTFIISKDRLLPQTIEMVAENQLLEVNISAKNKTKEIAIGNTHTAYFTGHMTDLNSKYALFVPFKTKYSGLLKTIQLKISDRGKGQRMPLKVNVYSKSNSGKPDLPLISDDIIVSNPEGKTNVIVDIRKYNIHIPTAGFFIVVQTLSQEYYEKGFVKSQLGYMKNRLPALFWTQKKAENEISSYYQLGFDRKRQWIEFFSANFCFSAKVQVEN